MSSANEGTPQPDEFVLDDPATGADEGVEAARAWVLAQPTPECLDFVAPYLPDGPRPPADSFSLPLDTEAGALRYVGAQHSDDPTDWRDAPGVWFAPLADDEATAGRFMAEANGVSSTFRNRHMAQAPALRCLLHP